MEVSPPFNALYLRFSLATVSSLDRSIVIRRLVRMASDSPKPNPENVNSVAAEEDLDLFRAAGAGESGIFSSLSQEHLQRAARVLRNEDGRSLLHVATSSGHTEVSN